MSDFQEKVVVDRRYVIPQAGVEALPIGTLMSVDINASGDAAGVLEMTAESTLGGVLVYSAYQSILTLLKSEAARKEGTITRAQQLKLVASTALDAGKSSAFTMLVASAIVAVMPWLTGPLTILGIVGGGVMATRVAQQFWQMLDADQQAELRTAAEKAKVSIEKMIPEDKSVEATPVAAAA